MFPAPSVERERRCSWEVVAEGLSFSELAGTSTSLASLSTARPHKNWRMPVPDTMPDQSTLKEAASRAAAALREKRSPKATGSDPVAASKESLSPEKAPETQPPASEEKTLPSGAPTPSSALVTEEERLRLELEAASEVPYFEVTLEVYRDGRVNVMMEGGDKMPLGRLEKFFPHIIRAATVQRVTARNERRRREEALAKEMSR